MSDQVALARVVEPLLPAQLDGLAEVVQKEAHEHDVAVESRIQRQHQLGQLHELQGVLEEPADVGVMHAHGGRTAAHRGHQLLVGQVDLGQRQHLRMPERAEQTADLLEHLVDVAGGGGQQRRQLILAHVHRLDLLDDELDLAVVQLGVTGGPHEPRVGQLPHRGLVEAPLPRHDLARGVAQQALEKGLPSPRRPDLRVDDAVHTLDVGAGRKGADIGVRAGGHGKWSVVRVPWLVAVYTAFAGRVTETHAQDSEVRIRDSGKKSARSAPLALVVRP